VAFSTNDDNIVWQCSATNEGKNAAIRVVGINPFKALPGKIHLMERRFQKRRVCQIADQLLNAAMGIVAEQVPVEAMIFRPFIAFERIPDP